MSDLPWLKFFPTDYLGDQALARASLEAQAVWVRVFLTMHQNTDRRGVMPETPDGEAVEVARMCGCTPEKAEALIAELLARKVASRDHETGRLCNRRMVRDEAVSSARSRAGRTGGVARGGTQAKRKQSTKQSTKQKAKQTTEQTPKQSVDSGLWTLASGSAASSEPVGSELVPSAIPKPRRAPPLWEVVLAEPEFDGLRAHGPWMSAWRDWVEHAATPGTKAKLAKSEKGARQEFRYALKVGPARHIEAIGVSMRKDYQAIDADYVGSPSARRDEPPMSHGRKAIAEHIQSGGSFFKEAQ